VLGRPQSSSRGPSPAGSSRSPLPPSAIPPRRSSHIEKAGGMSTGTSQQSLSDNDLSTPTDVTPLAFPVPQTRSSKRGEPTFCGQCGQVVHGQFVRAMGQVYHLNCFRCKVSSYAISKYDFVRLTSAGLQQGRCPEVLSRGRGGQHVPSLRNRLLCETGSHLRKMRASAQVELHHGLR
jgi:hypothetical protein